RSPVRVGSIRAPAARRFPAPGEWLDRDLSGPPCRSQEAAGRASAAPDAARGPGRFQVARPCLFLRSATLPETVRQARTAMCASILAPTRLERRRECQALPGAVPQAFSQTAVMKGRP